MLSRFLNHDINQAMETISIRNLRISYIPLDLSLFGRRGRYSEEDVDPGWRNQIFQNLKFDRIYS